jgi:hypothetical protein
MRSFGRLVAAAAVAGGSLVSATQAGAGEAEEVVARHMVGEALLAAHLVAVAEQAGMTPDQINAILKDVAASSAIDEFWITDEHGHAYLTNQDFEFTFSADPAKEPQAAAFWPLIAGAEKVVIQDAQPRDHDGQVFKYVGVAGIDKPRIVQVGVSEENLPRDE